jgi:hypothetical protein
MGIKEYFFSIKLTPERQIYDHGTRLNIDTEFRHYICRSKQKFIFLADGGLYLLGVVNFS